MRYNFDEQIDRRGTGSTKYDRAINNEAMRSEVAQLWVADMDFACPPPVLRAVEQSAQDRIFGYTGLPEMPRYYRAVCDYYQRHFDWYINSRDIVITPGVVPAIKMLIRALTRRGDGIIVQRPVYYPFFSAITDNNRRLICNPLQRDKNGHYTMDFDDLEKRAAQKNTTMMILCSPHNPVGRAWTREELERVYDICHRNEVLIVSDEIHCDLTRKGRQHIVLASLFPEAKDIITCTAPSKTFNIAGLQRSHIIIPNEQHREELNGLVTTNTNPITASAVIAAFEECDDWLSQVREYIDNNFNYLQVYLRQRLPKAAMEVPDATYLAWINVSKYTKNTLKLQKDLLEHEAVYIEEGDRFGKEGEGFLRVNVACPARLIKQFVDALANRLDRLRYGDDMPRVSLHCAWGGKLPVERDNKKKLIVFLPGVGSTFSQLYMAKLTAAYQAFQKMGIKIYVITGNTISALENRLNKKAIPYYLLSDSEGEGFKAYKVKTAPSERYLISTADNTALKIIKDSGIKDDQSGGHSLLRPAVFAVSSANKIIAALYCETLGAMPEPAQLLEAFSHGGIRE